MSNKKDKWYYELHKYSTIFPNGCFHVKGGKLGTPVAVLPLPLGDSKVHFDMVETKVKLIAAAPDILEALKRTEDFITRCLTLEGKLTPKEIELIVGHAREAIKKATK